MERPKGVTVIAILNFLGAAGAILLVLGVGLTGKPLADFMPELGEFPLDPALLQAVFTGALLFSALISAVLGLGLWKLQNWARIVAFVFACLSVLGNLFGVIGAAAQAKDRELLTGIVTLAYNGWIIWYLWQPHVKQAFAKAPPGPPATPGSSEPPPGDSNPQP